MHTQKHTHTHTHQLCTASTCSNYSYLSYIPSCLEVKNGFVSLVCDSRKYFQNDIRNTIGPRVAMSTTRLSINLQTHRVMLSSNNHLNTGLGLSCGRALDPACRSVLQASLLKLGQQIHMVMGSTTENVVLP